MKKLIVITLALTLFAVPAIAQEAPTQEQRIEQMTNALVEMKYKLGQEMMISAQLKSQLINALKRVDALAAKVAELSGPRVDKDAPQE